MANTPGHRDRPTDLGVVRINNDAITTIASTAAMEVRGVCKMGGGLRKTILEIIHRRSFGGVRVFVKEGELPFLIPVHGQKVSVDYVDKIEAFFREREEGD